MCQWRGIGVPIAPLTQSDVLSAQSPRCAGLTGGAVASSHETQSMFTPSVNFRVILSLLWYDKKYNSTKVCILSINFVNLVWVAFSCLQCRSLVVSFPSFYLFFLSSQRFLCLSFHLFVAVLCVWAHTLSYTYMHSPPHPLTSIDVSMVALTLSVVGIQREWTLQGWDIAIILHID